MSKNVRAFDNVFSRINNNWRIAQKRRRFSDGHVLLKIRHQTLPNSLGVIRTSQNLTKPLRKVHLINKKETQFVTPIGLKPEGEILGNSCAATENTRETGSPTVLTGAGSQLYAGVTWGGR